MASLILHDVRYFKRFRMEVDLVAPLPPTPELPEGYSWIPWSDDVLETHARVKERCFAHELDGVVFPNLACVEGCIRLMRDIRGRWGFRPETTWLVSFAGTPIGTIQGVGERGGIGAIQNVGVVPEHRGKGLGTTLVLKALHAFRDSGHAIGRLEVTAENEAAVRLYRRLGFRFRKTLYKVVDPLAFAPLADCWL